MAKENVAELKRKIEKLEAELEDTKVECAECGDTIDRSDAMRCSDCNEIICSQCAINDDICPKCAPHSLENIDC